MKVEETIDTRKVDQQRRVIAGCVGARPVDTKIEGERGSKGGCMCLNRREDSHCFSDF